jgi:hypothetical protein
MEASITASLVPPVPDAEADLAGRVIRSVRRAASAAETVWLLTAGRAAGTSSTALPLASRLPDSPASVRHGGP